MPFRPLNDKERQYLLDLISKAKESIATQQWHLSELESRLAKGTWYSNTTQDEYETMKLFAEYDIVWFDQLVQESDRRANAR